MQKRNRQNPTYSSPHPILSPPSLLPGRYFTTVEFVQQEFTVWVLKPKLSTPNVHRNAPHPFSKTTLTYLGATPIGNQKKHYNVWQSWLYSLLSVIEGSGTWLFLRYHVLDYGHLYTFWKCHLLLIMGQNSGNLTGEQAILRWQTCNRVFPSVNTLEIFTVQCTILQ